jgi:hypothetical protein
LNIPSNEKKMVEVGIAEYFSMAEALGIIATLFVITFFSRKQMQSLSVDIQTKVLNDLDEKYHNMAGLLQHQVTQQNRRTRYEWRLC